MYFKSTNLQPVLSKDFESLMNSKWSIKFIIDQLNFVKMWVTLDESWNRVYTAGQKTKDSEICIIILSNRRDTQSIITCI